MIPARSLTRTVAPFVLTLAVGLALGWIVHTPGRSHATDPNAVPVKVRVSRAGPSPIDPKDLTILAVADPDATGEVVRRDKRSPRDGSSWQLTLTYPSGRRLLLVAGQVE